MTTKSTEEAMEVLGKYRAHLIAAGRYEAVQIAKQRGTVHSRVVLERLQALNLVPEGIGNYWLGAVFNGGTDVFEWTGDMHAYSDAQRNIHERSIKLWRLKNPEHCLEHPGDPPPTPTTFPRKLNPREQAKKYKQALVEVAEWLRDSQAKPKAYDRIMQRIESIEN